MTTEKVEAQGGESGESSGPPKTPDLESLSDRELDALVAERVMGYRWWSTRLRFSTDVRRALHHAGFANDEWWLSDGTEEMFGDGPSNPFMSNYSTNISAAMEVVERMKQLGWRLILVNTQDGPWLARFVGFQRVEGEADNMDASRAICLAALQATASASALSKPDTPESTSPLQPCAFCELEDPWLRNGVWVHAGGVSCVAKNNHG